MAANPQLRMRFSTDPALLARASKVVLQPPKDSTVLFAEDEGARLAKEFVSAHPGYVRLNDVLQKTPAGQSLCKILAQGGRPWSDVEEVWWELSWRLAREAQGVVHVPSTAGRRPAS